MINADTVADFIQFGKTVSAMNEKMSMVAGETTKVMMTKIIQGTAGFRNENSASETGGRRAGLLQVAETQAGLSMATICGDRRLGTLARASSRRRPLCIQATKRWKRTPSDCSRLKGDRDQRLLDGLPETQIAVSISRSRVRARSARQVAAIGEMEQYDRAPEFRPKAERQGGR